MKTLELIAVGDIDLACPVDHRPFQHVIQYLRTGDIVFGNLECVLCDAGASVEKEVTLRASPARAEYLRQAGFNIVSLANNHTLDFGRRGLVQTFSTLREQGIRFIGAGYRASSHGEEIIECRGLKVGFLAYGDTDAGHMQDDVFVNGIHGGAILDRLRCLKPHCDVLIVSLHWGVEYVRYPWPGHMRLARELVAEGAHLVLGHHPHVVQGVEQVGASLIAYSLGSFHFQPLREDGTQQSCMLHVRISSRGVERYRMVPIRLDESHLPRPVRGQERREMMRHMRQISLPIRENRITERWWFEQAAPVYLGGNIKAWIKRVRKYGARHLMQFMRWLISGFTIKCYLGFLRRRVKSHG